MSFYSRGKWKIMELELKELTKHLPPKSLSIYPIFTILFLSVLTNLNQNL